MIPFLLLLFGVPFCVFVFLQPFAFGCVAVAGAFAPSSLLEEFPFGRLIGITGLCHGGVKSDDD